MAESVKTCTILVWTVGYWRQSSHHPRLKLKSRGVVMVVEDELPSIARAGLMWRGWVILPAAVTDTASRVCPMPLSLSSLSLQLFQKYCLCASTTQSDNLLCLVASPNF
eukprot:scaffold128567_cov48-Cyclotella_meneghiniana.AAC.1